MPHFDFEKALEWQKLRGTPEAITVAFELVGVRVRKIVELEVERWNFYKVLLENQVGVSSELLILLCVLSAPLRSKLYRIADLAKEIPSLKLSSKTGKLGRNTVSNFSGKKLKGIWTDL